MSTSAKLLLISAGCLAAFVLDVIAGHLLYGERNEGYAGLMNFAGLGLAAAAVMTLAAGLWSGVTARRTSSRR